jgi:hypothetical protein
MAKKVFVLLLALLAMALPGACSTQPAAVKDGQGAGNKVTVAVTRDFGRELILERETLIGSGASAMEALQSVAEVETRYGGGFVGSINGISSKNDGDGRKDWFFYINGIAGNVGAGDYILQAGDVEHWDWRDWSYQQFVPAIVGDYPQPFRGGDDSSTTPTVIFYEEAFAGEAGILSEKLKEDGVTGAFLVGADQLSDEIKRQSDLIIIAGPGNGLVSELNRAHKKLGFYAYLYSGAVIVLDAGGSPAGKYGPGCGLVQATQNPWNPRGIGAGENVVWMVTGADDNGVRNAVTALSINIEGLRYAFAAIISGGKIIKIP